MNHAAGVTLNRSLYETVLRELLLERAEHTVELYEGSGAAWRKARSVPCSKTHTCKTSYVYLCLLKTCPTSCSAS